MTTSELVHVQRSRHLAHDPAAIWAVLARFDRIVDWAPKVGHSSLTTEQAEGVGTARRVQVGRQALLETVTIWEPERTLAYAIDGLPPLVAGVTNRWDLAPDTDGRTFVTMSSVIDPGTGPKGKVGARVLKVPLGQAADSMLDGLAAHLDRTAG
jgi:carbon monoxide dehydrogenase subunit G